MNYARSRYKNFQPMIGRSYLVPRIGQGGLVEAGLRLRELRRVIFSSAASMHNDPVATSPVKVVLAPGSSAYAIDSPSPPPAGWILVTATVPGAQGLGETTYSGWVSVTDVNPASPYLRSRQPGPAPGTAPAPGQGGPPIQTTPGMPGPAPAAAPSTLRSIGEFLLLTAPAWGSYLYTRYF